MTTSSSNSSSSDIDSDAAVDAAPVADAAPSVEEHVDGRKLRAERTRAAVIDALLDLLREDGGEPPLELIAERAHVSPRSIFVHFHDREGLFTAAADRQTALTMEMMSPVDLSAPLPKRIDDFIDQRVRINDFIDPIRRAATRWENRSPVVSERLQAMRKLSRAEVKHVFEPELGKLDGEEIGRAHV